MVTASSGIKTDFYIDDPKSIIKSVSIVTFAIISEVSIGELHRSV